MTMTEERQGRCYELAAKYVLEHGGILVHGTIYSAHYETQIGHGWVELPRREHGRFSRGARQIWEPISNRVFEPDLFELLFLPRAIDK